MFFGSSLPLSFRAAAWVLCSAYARVSRLQRSGAASGCGWVVCITLDYSLWIRTETGAWSATNQELETMTKHALTATVYDKRGRVLAVANNNYRKSHPVQAHFAKLTGNPHKVFLHAEIAALLKCGDKKPYRIHVERKHKDGTLALAQPCAVCMCAIKAFGVQQVSFSVG